MLRTRTIGSVVVAATTLLVTPLLPREAMAYGHGHGHVVVGVGFGGYYGWAPYWGYGWGPYWGWGWGWGPGPYYGYYGEPARGALGYAMASGLGALDMNVKPNRAEVWADGRYVADARDLDGDPSYLWLKQGTHHLVVYMSGYRSYERDVDVHVGVIRELKVVLEKGESLPPVPAPPAPPAARGEASPSRGAEPLGAPAAPRMEAEPEPGPHGTVGLRVQPADATVYVDGQYRGTARDLRRLRLVPGHHRVEVVRPGYLAVEKEIDLEADRTVDLDLSLERSGGWKY